MNTKRISRLPVAILLGYCLAAQRAYDLSQGDGIIYGFDPIVEAILTVPWFVICGGLMLLGIAGVMGSKLNRPWSVVINALTGVALLLALFALYGQVATSIPMSWNLQIF